MFKFTINYRFDTVSNDLVAFHSVRQFLISLGWTDLGSQSINTPENITYYGVSNGNWCLYYGKRSLLNEVAWYISHINVNNNFLNIYTGSREADPDKLPASVFCVMPKNPSDNYITVYASMDKIFIVTFRHVSTGVVNSGNTYIGMSNLFVGYRLLSFFDLGNTAVMMNDVYMPYTVGYSRTTSHRVNLIVARKNNNQAYYYFNLPRSFLHQSSDINNPLFDRVKIYGVIPSPAKNAFITPLTVWVRDKKLNHEFTMQLPDDIYYTTKSCSEIGGEPYITLVNNVEYYTILVYPYLSSYILLKKYD